MDTPNYDDLLEGFSKPHERLIIIAKQLRQISEDMAAGKEVNPPKIKKLAGSLDYWTRELFNTGFFCYANPASVIASKCEWIKREKGKNTLTGQVLRQKYGEA